MAQALQKLVVPRSSCYLKHNVRAITTTALKNPPPERDLVNYPRPEIHEFPPVKMFIFPKVWFDNLYPKTGVTGPYVLAGGFAAFLLSKELVVGDHEFISGISLAMALRFVYVKLRPTIDEKTEQHYNKRITELTKIQEEVKDSFRKEIAAGDEKIQISACQPVIYEAKKEMIGFQLESAYRKRLIEAHKAIKNKLDYQLEVANVKNQVQQKHAVDWIINSVKKSITPAQEAASLNQCFSHLKSLAAKA